MAQGFGGGGTPTLTGGVSTTGGFSSPSSIGGGEMDMNALMSLFGQVGSQGGGILGSLMGEQQQQQQGNTYNQMMPSPMLPQQMLPMIQNTFVPQTQMQNFQPYSLLNGNLG
jgi:hypothetical protein